MNAAKHQSTHANNLISVVFAHIRLLVIFVLVLALTTCATPAPEATKTTAQQHTATITALQAINTATAKATPHPTQTATHTPTSTPSIQPIPGQYRVAVDTTFIREGPGLSFPVAEAGTAQAGYNSMLEFDTISIGESINATPWWGHLQSGLGFVSITSVVNMAQASVAFSFSQPQAGRYLVIVDTVLIREGPGLQYPIAEAGTALAGYHTELELDSLVQGDLINSNPWWGHLRSGLGFVTMAGIGPRIADLSIIQPTGVLPTLSIEPGPPTAEPTQVQPTLEQPTPEQPTQVQPTPIPSITVPTAKPTKTKEPRPAPSAVPTTPVPVLPTTAVPLPSLIVPPVQPTEVLSPTPCTIFNCPTDGSLPDLNLAAGGPNDPTFHACTTPHLKDGKPVPYIDTPEPRLVQLGQHRFFYLCDFADIVLGASVRLGDGPGQAVTLLSEVPNRDLSRGAAQFVIDWPALPDQQIGDYTIAVEHGQGLTEQLLFSVEKPTNQYMLVVPLADTVGSAFQIYYVNFPINSTATIELYREDKLSSDGSHIMSHIGRRQIVVSKPMVGIDGNGWAVETLQSQATDPIAPYALSYDADRVFSIFWLR